MKGEKMGRKIVWFSVIAFLFLLSASGSEAKDITKEQLATIFSDMESAISDISFKYEWYDKPPLTINEAEKQMGSPNVSVAKNGICRFNLYLSRPAADSNQTIKKGLTADTNDPNLSPLNWRFLTEESATLVMKDGNSYEMVTKQSFDGNVSRNLNIDGWPRTVKTTKISGQKQKAYIPLNITPMGFSIYNTSLNGVANYYLLSTVLEKNPEMIRLDTTVQEINGFKTIHLDLLQQTTKMPVLRIYLSIDHNYTLVKYDYLKGDKSNFTYEVQTFEKIGDNLWFPSSGFRTNSNEPNRMDAFQATSPVICNQKRDSKYFEIELPSGTEVTDEIKGNKYVVK
jgi:hypothetical protein